MVNWWFGLVVKPLLHMGFEQQTTNLKNRLKDWLNPGMVYIYVFFGIASMAYDMYLDIMYRCILTCISHCLCGSNIARSKINLFPKNQWKKYSGGLGFFRKCTSCDTGLWKSFLWQWIFRTVGCFGSDVNPEPVGPRFKFLGIKRIYTTHGYYGNHPWVAGLSSDDFQFTTFFSAISPVLTRTPNREDSSDWSG